MNLNIIIPILNPNDEFFTKLIPALRDQTLKPEILLINSGSVIPDGEYEVIKIDKGDFNHANTRNIALQYEADFHLFMTQDAIPCDDDLITNLVQAFDNPGVVVAYARQVPKSDADPIEKFARETNYPPHSCVKAKNDLPHLGIKTFFNSDSCAMYRGSYFRSVNGFMPDLNTNEDMEFAARAIMDGKKVAYCAEAKVFHSHRFSMFEIWKRYCEIGKFFGNNSWILEIVSQYTKAESTGIKQAIAELKFLSRTAPMYLFRSAFVSLIKFSAFRYSVYQSRRSL